MTRDGFLKNGIYIAAPSLETPRARRAAEYAQAMGWEITEPWWERVEEARRNGWMSDAEVPPERARECAVRNLKGIDRANRVVVLCREEGGLTPGTCGELLYTVGVSRWMTPPPLAVIVGDPRHVFGALVPIVPSIEDAIPKWDQWK